MHVKAKISAKTPEAKRENLLSRTGKTDSSQSIRSPINHILHLQRTIGNRAVQRLFSSGAIQAKLKIGQPNDIYEQEADRVANDVMSTTVGSRQKAVSSDLNTIQKLEEEEPIQPKPLASGIALLVQRQPEEEELQAKQSEGHTPIVTPEIHDHINSMRGSGQPLSRSARSFFEPRFGTDFSGVRVHNDTRAASIARSINARAFTLGRNVVFGAGEYSSDTLSRRELLAHELTHVVQQESVGAVADALQRKSDDPALCGGVWKCAASPCEDPDPGRTGGGGPATWWRLKIMIDVEAPSAEDVTASTVGHTYIEFVDSTGRTYTYGFYPDKSSGTPDPVFRPRVRGCVVHPDTSHKPCVDYTEMFTLAKDKFSKALSYAQALCTMPPQYNILTWNCTTFAAEVVKKAGKSLPPVRGKVGYGILSTVADNPYKLYKELKLRDIGPTYGLTGDTEIRDAINGVDAAKIARIPITEKIRIVNRLLDGWVSDDDIRVIGKVYRNTPASQRPTVKKVIEARLIDLTDIGQRTRVRVILAGGR